MTLHEMILVLNPIIKDKANLPNIQPEEANYLFKYANTSLFQKILKNLKAEAAQLGINERDHISKNEDLRPFKTQSAISFSGGAGIGTLPSLYVYALGMNATFNTSIRNVEIVSEEEKNYRIGNMIAPPIDDYPVAVIDISVRVWPTNASTVTMQYIKEPTVPVYAVAYASASGLNAYSSGSSTQFEWNEHNHVDLIMEILNILNVSASVEEVKKYLKR